MGSSAATCRAVLLALACCLISRSARAADIAAPVRPWLEGQQGIEERITALLNEMTLTEKIGQLRQTNGIGGDATGDAKNLVAGNALYQLIRDGQLGSILNEINLSTINEFQRLAVEESRLGNSADYRSRRDSWLPHHFSHSFGTGRQLESRAGRRRPAQSPPRRPGQREFTGRLPRWSTSLAILAGVASPKALAKIPTWLAPCRPHRFAAIKETIFRPTIVSRACVKHFVGYGAAEGGRDYNTTVISPSLMRNVYLPPFHAAVDAGVATLMSAFNDVNGIPMSGHKYLLTDVLREEWGFHGFVVSDWESIREMIPHGFAADEKDAARAACAGRSEHGNVEPDLPQSSCKELVEEGVVSEDLVDELVREILQSEIPTGFVRKSLHRGHRALDSAHRRASGSCAYLARQSVVLLKNDKERPAASNLQTLKKYRGDRTSRRCQT